jgi:hypothetical protein
MATILLADVQFTSTTEQFDVLQMRYSGEPLPLTLTVAVQAASIPVTATIFDEYCVEAATPVWAVKAKSTGVESQTPFTMQLHDMPSQTSMHPAVLLYRNAPVIVESHVVVDVPAITAPPPAPPAFRLICAKALAETNMQADMSKNKNFIIIKAFLIGL